MKIALWIIIILVVLTVLGIFIPPFFIAIKIYKKFLVRTSPDKWGHECSDTTDEEQVQMYQEGEAYMAPFKDKQHIEYVVSDGFKLYGEYFDFGKKKAVIIIPGRTESSDYSYFFAKPYVDADFNILVIDNRSHGYSEGKYPTLGKEEYKDIRAWAQLLHDKYHNEEIILHGICIGASTAMYTVTKENAPDYIKGIVVDGMYTSFHDSFKNHLIQDKRMVYPFIWYIDLFMKVISKSEIVFDGPYKQIKNLKKPILMIHSKQDVFSTPDQAEKLYNLCQSKKRIEWFDKGRHSHVRINNKQRYDAVIKNFVTELDNG